MTGWPGVRRPIMDHPSRVGRDIPALEPQPGANSMGILGMTESLTSYTWPDPDVKVPAGMVGCMGAVIDGWEILSPILTPANRSERHAGSDPHSRVWPHAGHVQTGAGGGLLPRWLLRHRR